eukprot:459550_1
MYIHQPLAIIKAQGKKHKILELYNTPRAMTACGTGGNAKTWKWKYCGGKKGTWIKDVGKNQVPLLQHGDFVVYDKKHKKWYDNGGNKFKVVVNLTNLWNQQHFKMINLRTFLRLSMRKIWFILLRTFTDRASGLVYDGESGGMNEAYSDIVGVCAGYHLRGWTRWKIGYETTKSKKVRKDALRYMYDPPLDGHSIGHYCRYRSGMDVHSSSGVYNKAAYLLRNSKIRRWSYE